MTDGERHVRGKAHTANLTAQAATGLGKVEQRAYDVLIHSSTTLYR